MWRSTCRSRGTASCPSTLRPPEILGERSWPSLTEAAKHHHIDLVDVFRDSAAVPPIADEAIAIGARALWLQIGVCHDEALAKAQAAGLGVVQDRCTLVEHQRLRSAGLLAAGTPR